MGVIRQEHDMASGKFIALRKLEYVDRRGVVRSWESADRVNGTPRSSNRPSAVLIIARIVPDNELLLVRQFRYPYGEVVTEIPAGKREPGEEELDYVLSIPANQVNAVYPSILGQPDCEVTMERVKEEETPANDEPLFYLDITIPAEAWHNAVEGLPVLKLGYDG